MDIENFYETVYCNNSKVKFQTKLGVIYKKKKLIRVKKNESDDIVCDRIKKIISFETAFKKNSSTGYCYYFISS